MPLLLLPVQLSDFASFETYLYHSGGDLIAPMKPFAWPATDPATATLRNTWSIAQQRHVYLSDKSARFLKVVDTDLDNETISLGRWHFYPNGYPHTEETMGWEFRGPTGYANEAQKRMTEFCLRKVFETRYERGGPGPQWILTTLTTKVPHHRRGAGGMIVRWGIERAEEDGVPAFVEGSELGTPLYKVGFSG